MEGRSHAGQAAKAMRDEKMKAEIEDFLARLQPAGLSRHADQWGSGTDLVEPARHEWAIAGRDRAISAGWRFPSTPPAGRVRGPHISKNCSAVRLST